MTLPSRSDLSTCVLQSDSRPDVCLASSHFEHLFEGHLYESSGPGLSRGRATDLSLRLHRQKRPFKFVATRLQSQKQR